MAAERRWQDTVFLVYFVLQIPSTLLFDTQGVYPEWLYPGFVRSVRAMYLSHYKDPYLGNAWQHPWYLSVCLVEHFIEMPFFVVAALAYYSGAKDRPGVLLGSIAYSVHTITICLAVWFMAQLQDFTQPPYGQPVPATFTERLTLCSAYFPFMATSIFCLWDSVSLILKKLGHNTRKEQ